MSKTKQELGSKQKNWIKALRSGRFKQAHGVLKNDSGYCCLGVADELRGGDCSGGRLIEVAIEYYKLYDQLAHFKDGVNQKIGGELVTGLAAANDHGKTFKQIADFIEANPEIVFTGPA